MLREYERYWRSLGERPIEQLVDLPIMTDRGWELATELLLELVGPAVATDANLLALTAIHVVQVGLRHGHCDAACFAYSAMGALAGPLIGGDWATASQLAKLTTDLMDRRGLVRHRPMAYQSLADVGRWIKPLREMVDLRQRQFELAEKGGALNVAAYAVTFRLSDQLYLGDPLEDVMQGTVKGLDFVRRAGFGLAVDTVTTQQRLVLCLQGKTDTLGSFASADFNEAQFEAHLATAGPLWAVARCWHYTRKVQARFLAGDWAGSLEAASKARETLWTSPTYLERIELTVYSALALAALHESASPVDRATHRERLVRDEEKLRKWARECPDNFEDRHALVAAELARIDGAVARAADLYEHAIASAKKNGYVNGEALAYELASRFYRGRGFVLIADAYLREARDRYLRWGAHGKLRQIDRLHPWLPRSVPQAAAGPSTPTPIEHLDLLSVLRATQTISREIDQDALLCTLLEVVLQEGGARTARLVLVEGDDLRLEGEASTAGANVESVQTRLLGSVPVSSTSPLPLAVLDYARRTKRRVVIDDARADPGSFANCPYLAGARSILVQPVLRQDQVVALLVLENDLVPGVFTAQRLTALELLATQAAISMENALLLRREHSARVKAEDSIRARDEFLAVASHELRTPVTSLMLLVQALRAGKTASTPENIARAVELFERQTGKLTSLIDDMLSVGRFLVGRTEISAAPTDLAALVREEVERSAPALVRAKCALTLHADTAVEGSWDHQKVSEIVRKLLANAIKFGAGKPIEIGVDEVGGAARLTVVDHGIGIEPQALPHIFEKFERGVSIRSYGGLGLGLFLVSKLVGTMGGRVRAESVPRVETTFTVELPARSQRAAVGTASAVE
jgi:signal transduction histidine kinase